MDQKIATAATGLELQHLQMGCKWIRVIATATYWKSHNGVGTLANGSDNCNSSSDQIGVATITSHSGDKWWREWPYQGLIQGLQLRVELYNCALLQQIVVAIDKNEEAAGAAVGWWRRGGTSSPLTRLPLPGTRAEPLHWGALRIALHCTTRLQWVCNGKCQGRGGGGPREGVAKPLNRLPLPDTLCWPWPPTQWQRQWHQEYNVLCLHFIILSYICMWDQIWP